MICDDCQKPILEGEKFTRYIINDPFPGETFAHNPCPNSDRERAERIYLAPGKIIDLMAIEFSTIRSEARAAALNEAAKVVMKHIRSSGSRRPHGDACFEDLANELRELAK